MRARNIKPGFFKNEYISELRFEVRVLFIGLWTLADREGRLEDRPKRIKIELFPGDNLDINSMLDELAQSEGEFIKRYEANGKRYIQILNFSRHQKPHKNEAESQIPAPPENSVTDCKTTSHQGSTDFAPRPEVLATLDRSNRADSLNPDCLNDDSLIAVSSSSDSGVRGEPEPEPIRTAAAAEVKTDPFFGQTRGQRVVYLQERQRWDAKAPWQTDQQRLEFESWLKARYASKEQPSRYAAAIICAAAEGKPCPDWDEFNSGVVAEVAAIDQQDPSKIDWANHPNRDRWLKELHELGMRRFSTRPDGQIDQARAFFKHWAKQEGLVNYG